MLERLSVPETAHRLGKSQTQIRRMLAAGQLESEREELPSGQVRLWVLLVDAPPAPPQPEPAPEPVPASAPVALLADHSPHELAALQLAAHAQEQASQLTVVVAQLTAQLVDAAQDRRALEIQVEMLRIQLEVAKMPAPAPAPMAHHGTPPARRWRGLPDWLARHWGHPGGELA